MRQIGPNTVEFECPSNADLHPEFGASLVIAEPIAAGRDVFLLIESLVARVRGLVGSIQAAEPAADGSPDGIAGGI